MKYLELYRYLIEEEELTRVQAIRSINDIRKFDPEIKKALATWFETKKCVLVIEGVSFEELTTKEEMKPIRAFKMLDWVKREPYLAIRYLARRPFITDMSKVGSAKVAEDIEETDTSDVDLD